MAAAYDACGYKVTLTPRSGDHGRDLIAIREGLGCIKVLNQVRAYHPGHVVDDGACRCPGREGRCGERNQKYGGDDSRESCSPNSPVCGLFDVAQSIVPFGIRTRRTPLSGGLLAMSGKCFRVSIITADLCRLCDSYHR